MKDERMDVSHALIFFSMPDWLGSVSLFILGGFGACFQFLIRLVSRRLTGFG